MMKKLLIIFSVIALIVGFFMLGVEYNKREEFKRMGDYELPATYSNMM